MSLEGPKGRIFLSFLYKVSEVPRNKDYLLIIYCAVHGGPINELESLSSLQKEVQCGKDFFKASKEATVHKAKLLTYPHIDGQLIIERLEESEIPSKDK